jgi:3-phosphoshikimate 1-carboxyvinyltransferase
MRFLLGKQREHQNQSLIYTIDIDFSAKSSGNINAKSSDNTDIESSGNNNTNGNGALNITIPGDEILAAALAVLKCLVPKGDLEITNVPLESWASQTLSLLKKMNCKVSAKENCKTAFGQAGTVAIPKSEYVGRKTRCIPFYQYIGQLPCMAVASAFAEGKSGFRDLDALRFSEPDGLDQLEKSLRPLGVRHGEMPDGIVVEGAKDFDGFDIHEPLPAYIAIAFCVAGLKCIGKTSIADDYILARWPGFENMINEICEFRAK